jgi:hypothetical protein
MNRLASPIVLRGDSSQQKTWPGCPVDYPSRHDEVDQNTSLSFDLFILPWPMSLIVISSDDATESLRLLANIISVHVDSHKILRANSSIGLTTLYPFMIMTT